MAVKYILILCLNPVLTFENDWSDFDNWSDFDDWSDFDKWSEFDDWPQFDLDVLERSNYYRQIHKVPGLFLNKTLTDTAQEWADYLAATEILEHRPDNPYGENIYSTKGNLLGNDVVDAFYNEMKDYDFFHPDFSKKTGHFTQLIWKNSRQIGIGNATGANGRTYVVINYYPAGNFLGSFVDNVPEPFY